MAGIKNIVKFRGVGLHSGEAFNMTLRPGNGGVVFTRSDLGKSVLARFDNVVGTEMRSTSLEDGKARVQTIEHLMAAFYALGIDNAVVETDGAEIPIMDGCAEEFYKKLKPVVAGRKPKTIIVKKEIVARARDLRLKMPLLMRILGLFRRGGRDGYVKISPARKAEFSARLVYNNKIIGDQKFALKDIKDFEKDVARARTFGNLAEWDALKKRGMARGANEENVIALDGDRVANPKPWGLRWKNEFARHKVLDMLGDFALAGGVLQGRVESYKGSHALNNLALRMLFSDPDNYEII
ncbi:MAG: UDP-3-O-acyl-N-acetylglucosamine deacetylase [Rickettsiales bacterium]|jgi:UDP-3-O-[3-hydroxymyristoyl] N-acetylglucosamine deacetylase|nr:UDP-3-O-acyl-N-acetylglucosamine deacetylase [Rickettsiales bacterium]